MQESENADVGGWKIVSAAGSDKNWFEMQTLCSLHGRIRRDNSQIRTSKDSERPEEVL